MLKNGFAQAIKKDNIQRKLKNDFRARVVASNHIIADIFGKDSGSIYEKGLIDSITEQEFDRCDEFEGNLELSSARVPFMVCEVWGWIVQNTYNCMCNKISPYWQTLLHQSSIEHFFNN